MTGTDIRVIVGASSQKYPGWIRTQQSDLDLAKPEQWECRFELGSVSRILAEHVWEHLTPDEAAVAAKICFEFLKSGGFCVVRFQMHTFPTRITNARCGPVVLVRWTTRRHRTGPSIRRGRCLTCLTMPDFRSHCWSGGTSRESSMPSRGTTVRGSFFVHSASTIGTRKDIWDSHRSSWTRSNRDMAFDRGSPFSGAHVRWTQVTPEDARRTFPFMRRIKW